LFFAPPPSPPQEDTEEEDDDEDDDDDGDDGEPPSTLDFVWETPRYSTEPHLNNECGKDGGAECPGQTCEYNELCAGCDARLHVELEIFILERKGRQITVCGSCFALNRAAMLKEGGWMVDEEDLEAGDDDRDGGGGGGGAGSPAAAPAPAVHFPFSWSLSGVSGTAHICAVHAPGGGDALHSIVLNGRQPRSAEDTLLLCGARARASALINSLSTVESEGGLAPGFHLASADAAAALAEWRLALGLRGRGVHVLLTRGEREVDPELPVFASDAPFSAVLAVPAGTPPVRWRGDADAAPAPPCAVVPLAPPPGGAAPLAGVVAEVRAALAAGDCAWIREPPAPALEGLGSLVLVEAGASLTAPLYAADAKGCPVDWVILSEYRGADIDESCVGGCVAQRDALYEMFTLEERDTRGEWQFTLLKRKTA
jgi:hypothetical protein